MRTPTTADGGRRPRRQSTWAFLAIAVLCSWGCELAPTSRGLPLAVAVVAPVPPVPRPVATEPSEDRSPPLSDATAGADAPAESDASELGSALDTSDASELGDASDGTDGSGLSEGSNSAQEGYLDLQKVEVTDAYPLQFHGRVDLAFVHFGDSRNVDEFRRNQTLPISSGLFLEYRFSDRISVVTEIEYEGREEELEVDQAALRIDIVEDLLTLRLGRYYFPFGLERLYYAPNRNTLVDRPAAFRQVYPGTYVDNGIFAGGKYVHHTNWALGYDGAITQGLRGFDREDLPTTLEDNNDAPQVGGRVYFEPRPELSFGVSYTLGYWNDTGSQRIEFFGADVSLEVGEVAVRAEYVGGGVDGTEEFGSFFRQGWYVHVEREFEFHRPLLHALVPVFRMDWIDANNDVSDILDVTRYAFGLATFFREDLQLKAEYSLNDERGRADIGNDGFLTQLVFDW